jgi:acyl dehydratase
MAAREIRSVEELKGLLGREAGVSDWIEVTQDRIERFAGATGDRQWIHVDPERARAESPYGAPIAHGFLTLSLLSTLFASAVRLNIGARMGINYGLNRVRFPGPVRSGSRVRGRLVLQQVDEHSDFVQLLWHVTVEVENEPRPGVVAEWITRQYF